MPVRRLNTDERMKRTYLNLNLQAAQEDTNSKENRYTDAYYKTFKKTSTG